MNREWFHHYNRSHKLIEMRLDVHCMSSEKSWAYKYRVSYNKDFNPLYANCRIRGEVEWYWEKTQNWLWATKYSTTVQSMRTVIRLNCFMDVCVHYCLLCCLCVYVCCECVQCCDDRRRNIHWKWQRLLNYMNKLNKWQKNRR